jgi:membrane-associated phospholipid phosphatase
MAGGALGVRNSKSASGHGLCCIALLVFTLLFSVVASAQAPAVKDCDINALQICALHVLQDEVHIVTSPLHIQSNDLLWIAPFAAGTGYTLTQDASIMQDLGSNPNREKHFNTASNILGIYAPVAYSAVGFIAGSINHDEHLRETSMLVTEAGVDALILNTGLQYALDRQDPKQGSQTGKFWPHGTRTWSDGTSMPSEHCINVWSFARVVASEYPGWRTQLIVYSMATTVSFSRVLARQHFPSDVIVGSTFGYLIGGVVIHHRAAGMGGISLSSIQTANGKGIQLSYDFNH